jgi:hypothetical protein
VAPATDAPSTPEQAVQPNPRELFERHMGLCEAAIERRDFDQARRELDLAAKHGEVDPRRIDDAEFAHWMAEWRRLAESGDWSGARAAAARAGRLRRAGPAELRPAVDALRGAIERRDWVAAGDALRQAMALDERAPEVEALRAEGGAALVAAARNARDRRDWEGAFEALKAAEPFGAAPPDLLREIGYERHMAVARPAFERGDLEAAHRAAAAARQFDDTEEIGRILDRTRRWMRRGTEAWSDRTEGAVVAPLAAWAGRICAGDEAGICYVGGPDHGGFSDFKVGAPVRAAAAVVGDTLYMGAADGSILVADLRDLNGRVVRPDLPAGGIRALAYADGVLFVHAGDSIAAVDAPTGKTLWIVPGAISRPVVHGPSVYARTAGGVTAFDRATGKPGAVVPDASGDPVAVAERLIVPCGRILRAFGPKAWDLALNGPIAHLGVEGSKIYLICANRRGHILDVSGRLERSFELPRDLDTPPVISRGVLYAGAANWLVAIDETGRELWAHDAGSRVTSPLAMGDRIWFGTAAGRLVALHTDR